MATKPKPAAAAETKKPGTAMIKWEEELAREAAESAKMEESTATGAFFSIKSGVLTWNDAEIENNQMACVIVDTILENVSYEGQYDSDSPQPPICFAFARDEADLKPHQVVVDHGQAQNDQCAGCERNVFGTALVGRGKACKNVRRLALIPAGLLDANGKFTQTKNPSAFEDAIMGFMKLPVTSVKGYSSYVKQLSASLKRPPHGVFTKIKVKPDAKNQVAVTFEPIGLVPNELGDAIMKRRAEAKLTIMQPYNLDQEEPPAKPAARGRAPAKKGRKF